MNPRHPLFALATLPPLLALALCGGCASLKSNSVASVDGLPHLSPGHNQIMAWVPQDQAQTGSVARAVAHIALVEAKKATEAELCGGNWVFSGKLEQDDTTVLAAAPPSLGDYTGWQVRISWKPSLAECGVTPLDYSRALSRHLPNWMMAQTGQPLVLFHQGTALYHQDSASRFAMALNAAK